MYGLITGIILFVCILLILIVLVQNPKGGGLASSFSSSNQYMGVKRTADFIEKATWGLAAGLFVLSLVVAAIPRNANTQRQSRIQEIENTAIDPERLPSYPTTPGTPADNNQQQPVQSEPETGSAPEGN